MMFTFSENYSSTPIVIIILSILLPLPTTSLSEENCFSFETKDLLNGFLISASNPANKPNHIGFFCPVETKNLNKVELPVRIAQWGSRMPISPNDFKMLENCKWTANNGCKKVEIIACGEGEIIRLNCNGITEFEGKSRKYGEPWPHLLVEHTNLPSLSISKLEMVFEIKFKITKCIIQPELKNSLDPSLHTAQVTAYWTVSDKNPNSPSYNDYFWFGIPLFDYRSSIPPKYCDLDKGAPNTTNKLIYVVDGNSLWDKPTGDGDWKYLKTNVGYLLKSALEEIKSKGYFINSDLENFYLTTFNLGWEVTGPFDAEIEIANLKFTAKKI
ncbi:MAG: hypothetical protein N3G21_12780 [Candidatus Hydrogenedentes bacterium]|nr:hypothetical protein [Candidatus Hydrogenedentota bacterium]